MAYSNYCARRECNDMSFEFDIYSGAGTVAESSEDRIMVMQCGASKFKKHCANHFIEVYTTEDGKTMTLLIPDRQRDNKEDFIWCLPIDRTKWNKWYGLSEKFKTVTPDEHGAVRYINRMEGRDIRTVMLMPNGQQDDDTVTTAAAYLRFVKQISCRMYVVRCTDDPVKGAALIHAVAGLNPTDMNDVDFEDDTDASQEGNKA